MRVAYFLLLSWGVVGQARSDALLDRAIPKIRASINRPADYLCTETIDRVAIPLRPVMPEMTFLKGGSCSWLPGADDGFREFTSDRVRVDVLSTEQGELYAWPGDHEFQTHDVLRLLRTRPFAVEGFNGFLRAIFYGSSTFPYVGDVLQNGRQFKEYSFQIPKEKSPYWFMRGTQIVTAVEGTFLLDPETAELVRVVVKSSDAPKVNDICEATTMLDYRTISVNGTEILVPAGAVFELADAYGREWRNGSVYSACHEFTDLSKLRAAAPDLAPADAEAAKPEKPSSPPKLPLPDGLPFSVAFTQDIALQKVAAGDIVSAKLATPIQDSSKRVLVPADTPIAVRIMGEDSVHNAGAFGATLVFRLETLTMGGITYSFSATATQKVKDFAPRAFVPPESRITPVTRGPGAHDVSPPSAVENLREGNQVFHLPDVDMLIFLYSPNTDVLQFYQIQPDFILKAGKGISKWQTGGTGYIGGCKTGTFPCN